MTQVPASSHGSGGPDIDGTNGTIDYDDDGPLLDLLAKAGFTFDLKVRDADDPTSSILLRSPGLIRVSNDNPNLTLRNAAGTTNLFRFSPAVGICQNVHTPPADGSVQTGEISTTFNQTANAAYLALKAKDSGGTVRTGNVPLGRKLATVGPVSGAAFGLTAGRDAFLTVPVTYNPTGIATATCVVEISPDGVSFTTIATKTVPAIAALVGLVDTVDLDVPADWQVRLTVVNATIGIATFW